MVGIDLSIFKNRPARLRDGLSFGLLLCGGLHGALVLAGLALVEGVAALAVAVGAVAVHGDGESALLGGRHRRLVLLGHPLYLLLVVSLKTGKTESLPRLSTVAFRARGCYQICGVVST